jgi:hypothetical protein
MADLEEAHPGGARRWLNEEDHFSMTGTWFEGGWC